jgi:DNA-binding GntR family transcriptional regulator
LSAAPTVRAITLTEQAAANIHQRIVGGSFAPGERLVEQSLARELGVGQNVIREALISLAHRGFVKRIINRGTYVTQLSFNEAQKLAEVRAPLETLVCDKIQQRMQSEQLDLSELRALLAAMRAAANANDQHAFHENDLRFHQTLWALAGNEYLSAALEQIVVPLFAFYIVLFMRRNVAESTLLDAVEAHEKLVATIENGGASCAAEIHNLVNMSLKHHQGNIS